MERSAQLIDVVTRVMVPAQRSIHAYMVNANPVSNMSFFLLTCKCAAMALSTVVKIASWVGLCAPVIALVFLDTTVQFLLRLTALQVETDLLCV